MPDKDIETAFVAAAAIAKKVPKHLQEAAFNRALDHLLGRDSGGVAAPASGGRQRSKGPAPTTAEQSDFAAAIDRTRYPDVGATARIADRALKVLQLANDDLGVDGLTPGEIAEILTKKFRLPVRANSIMKALERETDTVDIRQSAERGRTFHLMAPGEEYLRRLRAGESLSTQKSRRAKKRSKAATTRVPNARPKADKPAKSAPKKYSGRPGPKAAIGQLLAATFFKKPRTISEIQQELKHKRGHSFSVQELAPALVRSLRDRTLTRERNASGQYEYSAT